MKASTATPGQPVAKSGRSGWRLHAAVLMVGLAAGAAAAGWWSRSPMTLPSIAATHTVSPADHQVNLLVVGDWGEASYARARVAGAMSDYAAGLPSPLDAVLLVGDNFYHRLTGADDPQWSLFEDGFDKQRLNVPFYASLGNHDYAGDTKAYELAYPLRHPMSRWKMPAPWYRVDLPKERPLVTVFMLDSNRRKMGEEEFAAQMQWLESELAKPRDTVWTVVCAHYPLFTSGRTKIDPVLLERWGRLLREHRVDFYLAGHDHHMEHLVPPGYDTQFIISGGGGKSARHLVHQENGPFAYVGYGFVHFRLSEHAADVVFLDDSGKPVHAFSKRPLREDVIAHTHTPSHGM